MQKEKPEPQQSIKKGPIVTILLIGSFVAILNQTLLNIALPEIMNDLQITPNTAQWLMTGFMLVNGVLIPVTAFLLERFSTRQLYVTAMSLFALGTLMCALAPSFLIILLGRFVQASGAAIMMPLMMNVILFIFPIEKRGVAMGYVGMAMMFAPAIGPTLSGWLVQTYSWRILFWIILPISLLCVLIGYLFLKNVTKLTKPKIDIWAVILSTFGFGGLLYGFGGAGDHGWGSIDVILALVIGVIGLALFLWREFTVEKPMLDFRVFRYNMYSLSTIIGVVVTMAMFSGMILIPLYMQDIRGFTPLESGLLLLPGAILMGIMSPITGWIFDRIGAKGLAIVGLSITTVTTWQFGHLTDTISFNSLLLLNTARMFGMSMVMMPLTTTGLNQLPKRLYPHGTAMSNTLRTMSGSIGTAFLVTLMTIRSEYHVQYMSSLEASIQGINDSFMVASGFSALALVLSVFVKRVKPSQKESEEKENVESSKEVVVGEG